MYDIQFLKPTGKEMALAILGVFIFLVVTFIAGYLLGFERAEDIYSHGAGTDIPGVQLEPVIVNQQQITNGIQNAEHTSENIAGTSHAIAESAHSIEAGVNEAGTIIDECQQLLGRIRNRAEENKATN